MNKEVENHVNLGFSLKGLTKKEKELFEGGGKTIYHAGDTDFIPEMTNSHVRFIFEKKGPIVKSSLISSRLGENDTIMKMNFILSLIANVIWVIIGGAITWFGFDTNSSLWMAVGILCLIAGGIGVYLSFSSEKIQ